MLMIPVMNAALVLGVLFTHPRALDASLRPWLLAAGGVALSLFLAPGVPAAGALAPWVVLTLVAAVGALKTGGAWRRRASR